MGLYEFLQMYAMKSQFLFMAQEVTDFHGRESRSGMIVHKIKKRIIAGTNKFKRGIATGCSRHRVFLVMHDAVKYSNGH
jgi:hypothetical protein